MIEGRTFDLSIKDWSKMTNDEQTSDSSSSR